MNYEIKKVWRNVKTSQLYCGMFVTGHTLFFHTLHKFHLHKLCHPCSSQNFAKIALSPGVQVLWDRLGLGQG